MAKLYVGNIVVRIPDIEYFTMPNSRKDEITQQISNLLKNTITEIRNLLGLTDIKLED